MQPIDYSKVETDETLWPSLTYKVENGRILGKTDGLDAMVQAVDKIFKTYRFSALYFTAQYGNDIDLLMGKPINFAAADLPRIIGEALGNDERVLDWNIVSMEQLHKDTLILEVAVNSIFGAFQIKQGVNI